MVVLVSSLLAAIVMLPFRVVLFSAAVAQLP